MKRFLLFLLVVALVVVSCTDRDDNITGVNIRIKNDSNINFVKVEVEGSEEFYENISTGDFSEYLEYETIAKYSPVLIEADSTNYNYTPSDDLVNQDSLDFGFYTYELSVTEEGDVNLVFKVD